MMESITKSFTTWKNKWKWRQKYMFYLHVLYIVLVGLFMGTLIYGIERVHYRRNHHHQPIANTTIIDASNNNNNNNTNTTTTTTTTTQKNPISYLDSVFTSYSALCVSGLITIDNSKLTIASQIIIFICICLGGFTFTSLPALLVKIHLERKRMMRRRRVREMALLASSDYPTTTTTTSTTNVAAPQYNNNNNNNNVTLLIPQQQQQQQQQLSSSSSYTDTTTTMDDLSLDHTTSHGRGRGSSGGRNNNRSRDNTTRMVFDMERPIPTTPQSRQQQQQQQQSQQQQQQRQQTTLRPPPPPQNRNHRSNSVSSNESNDDDEPTSGAVIDHVPVMLTSIYSTTAAATTPTSSHHHHHDHHQGTSTSSLLPPNHRYSHDIPRLITQEPPSSSSSSLQALSQQQQQQQSRTYRNIVSQVLKYKPPPASDISYLAHVWLFFMILLCEAVVLLFGFVSLMACLTVYKKNNGPDSLDGVNTWWSSLFLTMSAFNNAGMTTFSDNVMRFKENAPVLLTISVLIVFGNTCFPILLRAFIWLCYVCSKRNRLVFKYMLDKHHHMTVHLFPSLQTRVYATITLTLLSCGTLLGFITLVAQPNAFTKYYDMRRSKLFLTSFFQAVSMRAAGFQSVDLNMFSMGTLVFYVMMMRIKSQMACDLKEGAYKIDKREIQFQQDNINKINSAVPPPLAVVSSSVHQQQQQPQDQLQQEEEEELDPYAVQHMLRMRNHSQYISNMLKYEIDNTEDSLIESMVDDLSTSKSSVLWKTTLAKARLYLRKIWHHSISLLQRNNMWLVLIIILICLTEQKKLASDLNFTFFKIVFEVISAFGNVGVSLGHPSVIVSFSGVLSPFSQFLIIWTMIMGRHRGLSGSMDDQDQLILLQRIDDEKELLQSVPQQPAELSTSTTIKMD